MKKMLKKYYGIVVSITIIIIFGIYMYFDMNKMREYNKNLFYMDSYINIKLYSKDPKKAKKAIDEIEKIYKEYHELVDKNKEYKNITNIKTINNNKNKEIEIDKKLYDLLEFSIKMYEESNGVFNVNIGEINNIWKKYYNKKEGIPTLKELENTDINIKNIELIKTNKIKNNGNIDLDGVIKGYVNEKVSDYLKSNRLNKYLINTGGSIIAGDHYSDGKYKIALENPDEKNDYYKILNVNKKAIAISGGNEKIYEYDGKKYHHIIDPNTKFPPKFSKSVTVITAEPRKADVLSTILFLMSIEDGKEYIKNYSDVEVVWYKNNGRIETTEGIKKYE